MQSGNLHESEMVVGLDILERPNIELDHQSYQNCCYNRPSFPGFQGFPVLDEQVVQYIVGNKH